MKKILFLSFLLFFYLSANSQERKTGIINDPDGYTNIRSGKGSSFEVIEKLYEDELFVYVDSADQNWLKVSITKCNCDTPYRLYNQIKGYVHRSRIKDVNELSKTKRKSLFAKIFETELELYNKIISATDRKSKEYKHLNGKIKVFHDYQFNASLTSFTNYVCEFKDEELVDQYMNLMESQEGSADEAPTYALGRMFVCDPDWTFKQIRKHITLMNQLEWGLVNVIYSMPAEEADEHKRKYNELRVSVGMSKVDFSLYDE